jgi:hypothetical protein
MTFLLPALPIYAAGSADKIMFSRPANSSKRTNTDPLDEMLVVSIESDSL